ncbi:MAG: hypothetical protein HY074_08720, partial [Deltaproteobacteria bacterium]|nr:hypothetical protein [Deltaproteobacteria bacterium]
MANEPGVLDARHKGARKTKILVVRPDRIGDVVLSTPVLEALRHNYPDSELQLLVRDA